MYGWTNAVTAAPPDILNYVYSTRKAPSVLSWADGWIEAWGLIIVIKRSALREQVREEILQRMRTGAISPGEQINEVAMATELGVSRTPLREALIALEGEGQIASESGRGFRFLPLSPVELTELAPVIATLEGLAVELTAPADRQALGVELAMLADSFAAESAEHAMLNRRDDEWHHLLLSRCPNSRLLAIIEGVRATVHRYEALLVADEQIITRRSVEHAQIAAALIADDVEAAKTGLLVNWTGGVERLLASETNTQDA